MATNTRASVPILSLGQDFASMYGNPSAQGEWDPDWGTYKAPSIEYSTMMANAIQPTYVDKWGRKVSSTNWDDYVVIPGVDANSGYDNKDAAFASWLDAGAFYDPTKSAYDRMYWVPKQFTPPPTASNPNPTPVANTATGTGMFDENPTLVDEWDLLPILLPLALGAIGGGALGLFGGAGGEAAALGAAEGGFGASAGSLAAANAVGAAGGDALGALLAGNAAGWGLTIDPAIAALLTNAGYSAADIANIPTGGLSGGGGASGGAASGGYVDPSAGLSGSTTSGLPAYDPAAGLSGADYGSSLSYDAAEGLGGALSGGSGSSGGLLSNAGSASSGLFDSIGNLITGDYSKLISGGLSGLGGLLSGNAATSAAETQSDAIIKAAQIAADAAKFKPVGVTTRFGQSQFGYDANGNLVAAGYGLKPDIKAQQDKLMGLSENALTQYQGAQAATAPMGTAAQTMMTLGNNYLATTPEQQAQKYMNEQLALLSAPRETDMANLQARLAATGRGGLMMGGGTSGALASNPELNAYYNSLRQQDLGLAANATQGGMDYAKFGAGMVGSGGDMLKNMYSTQSAAYDPYKTALGGASTLEGLGQNAMDLGINIGAKGTAANAQSGLLMANGLTNAANVMAPSNAYSPWGSLLSGAGNAVSQYSNNQQQYKFDPFTGRAL